MCRLATVVGEAGVGKSRLLDELVSGLGEDFRILRGRCLAYGDGITFWPLAEAVRDAAQIAERDTTEAALEKLAALTSDPEVTERVASAIGLSAASFPVEELVWGARRLLECLGREQPVLALFDDIHWAEPTFLELIEQVVEHASYSQLVVICTARHEFVERNPDFSTEGGAVRILLERLSEADAAAVAGHLLGMAELHQDIRDRIVAAAEGNPLFIEQLLSMLIDDGAIRLRGRRLARSRDDRRLRGPSDDPCTPRRPSRRASAPRSARSSSRPPSSASCSSTTPCTTSHPSTCAPSSARIW